MFKELFSKWRWKQPEKHMNINIINAIELKEDSTYILLADTHAVTRYDMEELMKQIKKQGVRNVVGFMLGGSPDEAIQFVERTNKPKGKR